MADELIQDMTRQEAEAEDRFFRNSEGQKRIRLYVFRERNGWRKLGYTAFEDYIEERLDIHRNTAGEWMNQVRTTCDAFGLKVSDLHTLYANEKDGLLPQTVTRELRRLEPVERREVWQTYETLSDVNGSANHASPRDLARTLRNLVAQRLNLRAAPVVAPGLPTPPSAPSAPPQETPAKTTDASAGKPKPTVTTYTPPSETFPETGDTAEAFSDDEPEPTLHKVNAKTVQRDDGLKCLIIEGCLPNGDEVMMRLPYAMLPRDMQP